jgi:hypothetical protein
MDWFSLLERIRKLDGPFRTSTVAGAGLSPKDASAWISKFVKWGYAKRTGSSPNGSHKPTGIYELTDYGMKVSPKHVNRLALMLEASKALEEVRGTKSEAAAMGRLFKLAHEIEKALNESRKAGK